MVMSRRAGHEISFGFSPNNVNAFKSRAPSGKGEQPQVPGVVQQHKRNTHPHSFKRVNFVETRVDVFKLTHVGHVIKSREFVKADH